MNIRIAHEFPLDRMVEEENRHWNIRSGFLADNEVYFTLVSARTPKGTIGKDLVPERLEIAPDWAEDEVSLSVDDLREIISWPPETS